jgi:prevent-host-death family protein
MADAVCRTRPEQAQFSLSIPFTGEGKGLAKTAFSRYDDHLDGHKAFGMKEVTVAEAKAHLSELIDRAERGEPIRITRRGKPVVRIISVERQAKPIDLDALRALTKSQPVQESARRWLRSVRDEDGY